MVIVIAGYPLGFSKGLASMAAKRKGRHEAALSLLLPA
jgi:hypothetical protein